MLEAYRSPCSEGASHSARRVHFTPLGGYISVRSEGALHSARRVHSTPLGGYIPLCWEGAARPARSDAPMLFHQVFRQGKLEANIKQNYIYKTKFHCPPCSKCVASSARRMPLVLLEECRSSCSKRIARPARRMPLVLLGGCRSLRSEGTFHSARRVHLTPLGGCRSPCPKSVARSARRMPLVLLGATPPMLFHQVFRQGKLEADRKQNYICKTKFYCPPCSEGTSRKAETKTADLSPCKTCFIYDEKISFMSGTVIPKVIMYASTIKSEKYFRNIRDKSRPGIGVYFVEYGVNFRLRKCHYCKSRF